MQLFGIYRDHGPATFQHFSVTADLRLFCILSWPQTCDFLAFFRDRGPATFWHFSVTADQRHFGIFPWPRTCDILAFLTSFCNNIQSSFRDFCITADLSIFCIFRNRRPTTFWHFFETGELQLSGIFQWPRTWDLLAFFHDRGPATFWHYSLTAADLQSFGIFPWPRTCDFLAFLISFRDNGQASFRYFCITADLSIFCIFP